MLQPNNRPKKQFQLYIVVWCCGTAYLPICSKHKFLLVLNPAVGVSFLIAFDKGERLHSTVAFENFGAFIDTDLAPPKNSSGAKLFRENDVIFIGHVLNLVLRLSLLCLLNEVAM